MAFLTEAANRGSISTGYDIPASIKFEEDNLEGMYAQPTAAGNRRTWTVSLWFKRTELTTSGHYHSLILAKVGSETGSIYITPTDEIICDVGYGSTRNRQQTQMKFRDPSAWYHIVWRVDTTQGTAADRHRLYVNGVLQEWTTIDGYPAQNFESFWNNNIPIYVGIYGTLNNYGACAYMTEIHHTDGISNAPTEFGEFDEDTGIWKPIKYEGNYGAQGFYLPFDDSSDIGKNGHGNDVNFTLQNIAAADQATDTPTNNFCTLNLQVPNYVNTGGATEGGTKIPYSGVNHYGAWYGTQGFTKGKWYWEAYIPSRSGSYGLTNEMGVHTMENNILGSPYYATSFKTSYYLNFHYGYTYAWDNGTKGSKNSEDGVPAFGTGQVGSWVGLAFNADDGEATWYLDGSQTGNANLDIYDLYDKMQEGIFGVPFFQVYHNDLNVNFGGYSSQAISSGNTDANGYGNFEYAPPSGYYAICSKNLAEYG